MRKPINVLFLLIFLLSSIAAQAQPVSPLRSLSFPARITAADFDADGRLYVALADGSLRQLDSLGRETARYAPEGLPHFQQLFAFSRLQIIAFDAGARRLYFLDRFLREKTQRQLPEDAFSVAQIAPGNSTSLWLLDLGQRELRLWDYQNQQIRLRIPWSSLQELKNDTPRSLNSLGQQVLIQTEKGMLILMDQEANVLNSLARDSLRAADLSPNQLHLLQNNQRIRAFAWENGKSKELLVSEKDAEGLAAGPAIYFLWKGKKGMLYRRQTVQP